MWSLLLFEDWGTFCGFMDLFSQNLESTFVCNELVAMHHKIYVVPVISITIASYHWGTMDWSRRQCLVLLQLDFEILSATAWNGIYFMDIDSAKIILYNNLLCVLSKKVLVHYSAKSAILSQLQLNIFLNSLNLISIRQLAPSHFQCSLLP